MMKFYDPLKKWFQGIQPITFYKAVLHGLWRGPYGLLAVLVVASFYIYFGTLNLFFWADDFLMIKLIRNYTFTDYLYYAFVSHQPENPLFQYIHLGTVFRPVTHYVYWTIGWSLFETRPLGYHAVNLIIHTCNSLLIFWITFSITRKQIASFIAALLYTSAVVIHISAMVSLHTVNESLFVLFTLISFILYFWRRSSVVGRWASILSAISYALALFCNERAVVLPALIFLFDLLFTSGHTRQIGKEAVFALRHSWTYWALSVTYVLLRLPTFWQGVTASGSRYELTIGLWAMPKYYWGLKWFLLEYIEPARALKNTLFPFLSLDRWGSLVVLLGLIAVGIYFVIKVRSGMLRLSFFLRLVVFGIIWFLTFPAPIIFAKPFAAQYFAGAIIGLCFVGGYLGELIVNKISVPNVRIIALFLFTAFTVFSAGWLARDYIRDPQRNPHHANLTRQVLEFVDSSGKNLSLYDSIYLIGFPANLFSPNGSRLVASTGCELFLDQPVQIEQVVSLDQVPFSSCQRALILEYDTLGTVQETFLPPKCNDSEP